ncbi:hypothetical protein DRN74_01340 [Candidatus Micrarchaeota archaeon]|nr:MAG: hypothetical protein DRN74_01340 [Candidatus Micrarchaeota archaeon]
MNKIPFSPLPPAAMDKISNNFIALGELFSRMMPSLREQLYQAEMEISSKKYVAIAIVTALFYAILIFFVLIMLSIILQMDFIPIALMLSIVFYAFMFFSVLSYPRIITMRRMRKLETNLVPALRHLLIEVKSGVPLFQAMMGVTKGYGEVSEEFSKIVTDINTGKSETEAINDAARRNASFKFRRSLWQITNALKSGSDIGDALQAIIEDLSREQVSAIKKYGQELNPWTMIYMVAAVIIPSLGLTFLVVISSFTGAMMPPIIFPLILFGLILFQLFFMNFVKSRRPAI